MGKIYTHPGQPQMQVEVILASGSDNDAPNIYTLRLRYPRVIHGEIMTHRVFSRNARSSRAVPVKTMLDEVRNIPYVPWHWGKNQKGMQAAEECNEWVKIPDWNDINNHGVPAMEDYGREGAWLKARDVAADITEGFMNAGYHKQNPNRLLEPFSWMDTLITATDWKNFLHLRDHKDAEPHLQDLAKLVGQAIAECDIEILDEGNWHLPYIDWSDWEEAKSRFDPVAQQLDFLAKVSAARCARISYKPFDGDASYERELERYNQLVTSERVHASPLEHQAQLDRLDPDYPNTGKWEYEGLSGNLAAGWIQFRKTISGEAVYG